MRKVAFLLILGILCTGCMSYSYVIDNSELTDADLPTIPKEASIIEITSDLPASDLYDQIYKVVISRGHRIQHENREMLNFNTEGKDVGSSTYQRMNVVVSELESGSKVRIDTEWKAGYEAEAFARAVSGIHVDASWSKASWKGSRLGLALAESIVIAKQVNGTISYK